MCLKEIGKMSMTATARNELQEILKRLMPGPGGGNAAMLRAERELGLGYWPQWNLWHKRRASPAFIDRIRIAYISLLEQSVRRDIALLDIEKSKGTTDADDSNLMAEAQALLARIAARKAALKRQAA